MSNRDWRLDGKAWLLLGLVVAAHVALLALALDRRLDFLWNDAQHRYGPGTDFGAYYNAGVEWQSGNGIYGHGPGWGFRYHPLSAMGVGWTLSRLGTQGAMFFWLAIQELLLVGVLCVFRRNANSVRVFLFACALVLWSSPLLLELYMGNASLLAGGLILFALEAERRGRARTFLGLMAISILVKPIGLALLPLVALRAGWMRAAGVGLAVLLLAVPYFVGDPQGLEAFLRINFEAPMERGWLIHASSQGLHGFVARVCAARDGVATADLLSFAELSASSRGLLAALPWALVALSAFATWRLRERPGLVAFLWCATYLLGYKDVWEHSYVILVVGLPALAWDRLQAPDSDGPRDGPRAGPSSRAIALVATLVALPTGFFLYDVPLPPGPIDPEHHWSLGVSLLHHATRPLPLLLLYALALRAALPDAKPAPPTDSPITDSPDQEGGEAGR